MNSKMLTLLPESRLNSIFPDGQVPVLSDVTVSTPKGECFVLNDSLLSDAQLESLATLLIQRWGTELFPSVGTAISYIKDELPLEADNFFRYCRKSL